MTRASRIPLIFQARWLFRQPYLGALPASDDDVRDCPQTNPPLDLQRVTLAMTARTLHPGRSGVLNQSIPSMESLRLENSPWASSRERERQPGARRR